MAKQPTRAARIIAWLLANGYTETESSSRKLRRFTHPKRNHPLWVGKAGAFRSGRNATDNINAERLLPPELQPKRT